MVIKKILLLCGLLFCISSWAYSQKVALVLSGGGAKGLAHVGVLKALEENEIPIDYILGTSMGGVVGGFYAAGYSPDQIQEIILSDDFQRWVNGVLGDNYNFHYFKKENNASWITLNLAVDSSLNATLNSNLANDVALNFALTEMLAAQSEKANYDFDSLLIPFRAIASDIFTQNEIVLENGNLSDALRATLSVPFFYRPIKIDDKYLFDGGIYNNFPINVAKETFNPDIIIGVNVSSKKYETYPFGEDEKLIRQSLLFMLMNKTDIGLLDSSDIYIEPNLNNYSSLDFSFAQSISDSGYVETQRHMDTILHKISRRIPCEVIGKKRTEFNLNMKPLKFKRIGLVGFKSTQRKYIRSLFNINQETLNIHDIKSGYYKLVSEEYFKDIYPRITYDTTTSAFRFDLYGRPRDYLNVEFGGNLASRSISQIFLGLNFSHFNRILFNHSINFYTGRFYQSFQAKSRINSPLKLQFYLEPEFTYNHWDYLSANEVFIEEKSPTIINRTDRKAGLSIGFPIGTKGKLVATGSYVNNIDRFSNSTQLISTDTLDHVRLKGYRYSLNFSKSSLNRKQYPSSGGDVFFSLDYFDLKENYTPGNTSTEENEIEEFRSWFRLKIKVENYFKTGWYSYGYLVESVLSNQPLLTNFRASQLNASAFYPLNDSKTLFLPRFYAFNYGAVGLRNVFSIKRNLDFRLEAYLFKPFKEITQQSISLDPVFREDWEKMFLSASSTLAFHSPVGPIAFSVNYYDDPQNRWGVLLHIGYTIFNKRSLE